MKNQDFSKLYLVMLDKLDLSKILLIFLTAFAIFSCSREIYNTEIFCADDSSILVKFVTSAKIREAVKKAYERKIENGYSDKSTALILDDGRSFLIENISPEEMLKCSFRQSRYGAVDRKYVHHF